MAFNYNLSKQQPHRRRYPKRRRTSSMVSTPIVEVSPLASLAGKYNDEPLWDDLMEAIRQYRQEVDEQEADEPQE